MAEATKETRTGGEQQGELKQQLKMRHMTMISLGGVIGAGLFVGSGAVIASVGPAAVVSYLMAGLILVLVMRIPRTLDVEDVVLSVSDDPDDSRFRRGHMFDVLHREYEISAPTQPALGRDTDGCVPDPPPQRKSEPVQRIMIPTQ